MSAKMKRRAFITLLGGAAAWPLAARAQQAERMRRIGVLLPAAADDPEYQTRIGAFLQELAQSGWNIGRNVGIDARWAANAADIRRHAAELVALTPDRSEERRVGKEWRSRGWTAPQTKKDVREIAES